MVSVTLERHPENGNMPWVIVTRGGPFNEQWFSCRTKQEALAKLPLRRAQAQIVMDKGL